jgi:hypothetical protein
MEKNNYLTLLLIIILSELLFVKGSSKRNSRINPPNTKVKRQDIYPKEYEKISRDRAYAQLPEIHPHFYSANTNEDGEYQPCEKEKKNRNFCPII